MMTFIPNEIRVEVHSKAKLCVRSLDKQETIKFICLSIDWLIDSLFLAYVTSGLEAQVSSNSLSITDFIFYVKSLSSLMCLNSS